MNARERQLRAARRRERLPEAPQVYVLRRALPVVVLIPLGSMLCGIGAVWHTVYWIGLALLLIAAGIGGYTYWRVRP